MNEAVKPEVAERAIPAIPKAPAPGTQPGRAATPRRRSALGRLALLVALAAAAIFAWQKIENIAPSPTEGVNHGRSGPPPQTVRVAPVTVGDMPITLDELGTVIPFETVTIKTQISGKLMELGFAEGQMVKKGDFIAQIDPRPYQAALAQAQGQLAKDQALLAQAQSDLSRYQMLSKQDSISKQQVADQEALVAQDRAAIATDQAQVQTAQLNLDYTHIVSPITGRVGIRLVDPGNYLQPTDASGIVVITQLDPISVVFATPEDDLPRIATRLNSGAKMQVTAFDRANVNQLAVGDADHLRQSGRRHHRHDQDAGDLRQSERRPVSATVRERPSAGRHAEGSHACAQRSRTDRAVREFRLPPERRRDGFQA